MIPKELRFWRISVSKILAGKSSRVMGKAEKEDEAAECVCG